MFLLGLWNVRVEDMALVRFPLLLRYNTGNRSINSASQTPIFVYTHRGISSNTFRPHFQIFSFLRRNALERSKFLKRDSAANCSLLVEEIPSNADHKSFTLSYLINSCGLTEEKALSVSKKLQLETSTNPDAVLALFRDSEFPNTHITRIIQKHPSLLLSDVNITLKPKLEFFKSKGFSGPQLAKGLSSSPTVLTCSLDRKIIPIFDLLQTIFQTDENVIAMLQHSMEALVTRDPEIKLLPNLRLLLAYGVPPSNIGYLLACQRRVLLKTAHEFNEIIEEVKKMKINPSQCLFVLAIKSLSAMSKSSLEAKFDIYRSWGWSEEDIRGAFRKQPFCMMISEKKIIATMDYLVSEMGYRALVVAKHPGILLYSLKKRIIPRCSVIQILVTNGLVEKNTNIYYLLQMKENEFVTNFIFKFGKEVPELLKVYQERKMEP